MTEPIELISLDIGGTLGSAQGPGLTQRLVERSPLEPRTATAVIRQLVITYQTLTGEAIAEICDALRIPADPELFYQPAPPFSLYDGALDALGELAKLAPLVTLSNVSCIDVEDPQLHKALNGVVEEQFPSCRIGYAKPDIRAFRAVAATRQVPLERITHIGDDWACDVLGALDAGCRAMWISRGRPVPDERVLVDHEVATAADLAQAAAHLAAFIEEQP
jgi:FMN phosphatase YigB (HAD superfamily)